MRRPDTGNSKRWTWSVRLLLVPVGLALATLAFAHAASENGWLALGPGFFGRSGIDAHAMGEIAERGFRAETMAARDEVFAELEPGQAAALARDPAALEQFLQARRAAASSDLTNEFPRVSNELLAVARLTYAADPLDVPALRTIALGRVVHEDPEKARRIMRLAARLSKRDDVTDLWLAQDYGRLGEMKNMLAAFDHALRTSMRAREAAIGPVVGLAASPESRAALGDLLKRQPDWEDAFWSRFSRDPLALANTEAFFIDSGLSIELVPEPFRQRLYANLKRGGHFEALYRLAALDPAAGTQALSAGKFIAADGANPLGWDLRSRGDFAARVHDTTGELQIDARAGSFGVAADRVVRLGGGYELTIRMAEPVPDNADLELALICLGPNEAELATISLASGSDGGEARVSAGTCEFANLEVSFEVDPGRRASLIRIASIALRPV